MRTAILPAIICLLVLFCTATIFAQPATSGSGVHPGKINVQGKLLQESAGQPLSFATVSAFSLPDSTNVSNAFTEEDGAFQLGLVPGDYYLLFQYLGYQNLVQSDLSLRAGQAALDLGEVFMKDDAVALDVVEVSAERSVMQLQLDRRVFNVGKDLTNAGNSAADILNNVPSVTVDPEGNVSLRGSQGVRILVDGKPSAMLSTGDINALQRMQGDIIESIEVITNPSARYEAEGEAGIINIILKKNKKRGINGSFGLTAGYPENFGANYSLNYRQEDFNFFSNFGINYRSNPGGGSATNRFFEDGVLTEFFTTQNDRQRSGLGGNFQFGTDWFINPNNSLTASLLYRKSGDDNAAVVTYRDLAADGQLLNTIVRDNLETSNNDNFETSLNFKHTFKQPKRELTFDFKYILDDDLELADYTETDRATGDVALQRSSNTEYETNMLFQADYTHPLNKTTKVEGGLRTTLRTIKNDFLVEAAVEGGIFVSLPSFDDELQYNENILAAYVIGSKEWGKVGVQAGLRAELSDVTAALLKSDQVNQQDYLNLFPSASVSYQMSETTQLQISYSRRLSRPYFRLLLPFSNFTDPRNNSVGNPTLRPEYTDSYEVGFLRYLPAGSLLTSVYYRRTTGVIERLVLPADNGTTIRFPVNLSERNAYGLEFNFSYDLTAWWKFNTDLNFYQATVDGAFQEVDYSAELFSWSGRASSKLTIAKKLELQTTFDYKAPENNTQGRTLSRYSLDVGASLDVFAGKGTLTLSGRDLFNTRIDRRIVNLPAYQAESSFQWRRSQQVVLSFVYRLNQDKDKRGGGNRGGGDQGGDY